MLIGQQKEVLFSFFSITSHESEITGGEGKNQQLFCFGKSSIYRFQQYSMFIESFLADRWRKKYFQHNE